MKHECENWETEDFVKDENDGWLWIRIFRCMECGRIYRTIEWVDEKVPIND